MRNIDGPVVALVILVAGLLVLGLVIFIIERRHGGRHRRAPERLPLFGTEQLSIRYLQADGEGDEAEPALPPRAAASRPAATREPTMARPEPRTPRQRPAAPPVAPPPAPFTATPSAPRPAPPVQAPVTPPVAAPAAAAAPRAADFAPRPPTVRPTPSAVAGTATEEYPIPGLSGRAGAPPAASAQVAAAAMDAALIDGETLRFTVPTDGAVEFLPGHLEVVAGPDAGKEIRFARTPGGGDVEVTFGRSEGAPHRHVQILARTVSRRHALMSLIDEHWQLTNLSATNPVVLNGRVLAGNEVAPLLVEGDRIEMGEVVFVYHDA